MTVFLLDLSLPCGVVFCQCVQLHVRNGETGKTRPLGAARWLRAHMKHWQGREDGTQRGRQVHQQRSEHEERTKAGGGSNGTLRPFTLGFAGVLAKRAGDTTSGFLPLTVSSTSSDLKGIDGMLK